MTTRFVPYTEAELRALRTVANHPGSTPEDVAVRAFNGPNLHGSAARVSRMLRKLRELKLLNRGYAIIHTPKGRGRWFANHTYFVSRRGFEVLKCDERWKNN